jgi:osmoprotectant transport system permease protein
VIGLPRLHNRVLPTLMLSAAIATAATGYVSLAPNRLAAGVGMALWHAADPVETGAIAFVAAMLFAAAFLPNTRRLSVVVASLAALLLFLLLSIAGEAAARLVAGAPTAARVSPGAAFWVATAAAALALIDALQRLDAGPAIRFAAASAIVAGIAALAAVGLFDALSIVREYAARRPVFAAALLRHLLLVAGSVGPAIVIGFPLGVLASRRPGMQAPLFAVLNTLQTIPSIALFGLLIAPLSALAFAVPGLAALGIGGIGVAPAIVALALYALLPVARNTLAGLTGVAPAVIDAARGMGLSRRQILWRVELPLATPVLLAGLRIVVVQAIGLAVVAALIGAGGLGVFVFEGLGQYAVDLVLLGALPAIFLALAADFALQTLAAALGRAPAA